MKAFWVLDELPQFHWAMLKTVLLILSLLPMSQAAFSLWESSVWHCHTLSSNVEQVLFKVYRTIPMLCLASLVAYLALQWSLYL